VGIGTLESRRGVRGATRLTDEVSRNFPSETRSIFQVFGQRGLLAAIAAAGGFFIRRGSIHVG
jgi:hypothetical protein